jgi:hypothetical protein
LRQVDNLGYRHHPNRIGKINGLFEGDQIYTDSAESDTPMLTWFQEYFVISGCRYYWKVGNKVGNHFSGTKKGLRFAP